MSNVHPSLDGKGMKLHLVVPAHFILKTDTCYVPWLKHWYDVFLHFLVIESVSSLLINFLLHSLNFLIVYFELFTYLSVFSGIVFKAFILSVLLHTQIIMYLSLKIRDISAINNRYMKYNHFVKTIENIQVKVFVIYSNLHGFSTSKSDK